MYTKDKSNRITLRLNDTQMEYVRSAADTLGVSPSECLRMMLNVAIAAGKNVTERIGERRENEQTDKHDLV